MSEVFPSKAYIQECIKYQKVLREKWKKQGIKVGDYAMRFGGTGVDGLVHIVIGLMARQYHYIYLDPKDWEKTNNLKWRLGEWPPKGTVMYPFRDCIPLFTRRQLCQMLEERAWEWSLAKYGDEEYRVYLRQGDRYARASQEDLAWKGPDPETALLRCLLSLPMSGSCTIRDSEEEVVKDGEEEQKAP